MVIDRPLSAFLLRFISGPTAPPFSIPALVGRGRLPVSPPNGWTRRFSLLKLIHDPFCRVLDNGAPSVHFRNDNRKDASGDGHVGERT